MNGVSRLQRFAAGLGFAGVLLAGPVHAYAAELTFDLSDYAYREEDDSGYFLMRDESKVAFGSLGIRDWDVPAADGAFGLMYTAEGTAGMVSYHSRSSGTVKKMYYKARMEGYLGYRLNTHVTPFVGLGYRLLHDDSGGDHGDNGGTFYDRQNHLLYMPFGVRANPTENLSLKAQANAVLKGWQISYTSDGQTGYPDAHNTQDKGWGLDFAADYRVSEKWSTYTFFRYWSIDRSDNDCGNVPGRGYVCWWEPDNTTREFGVGVAYRF